MKTDIRKHTYIKRAMSLKKAGFESYSKYLSSETWKQIRNECFDKKGRHCHYCRFTKDLQVHHLNYTKNNLKNGVLPNLMVLCGRCHGEISRLEREHNLNPSIATAVFKKACFPALEASAKPFTKRVKDFSERTFSLRIVESSGLPETLHHSVQSLVNAIKGGLSVDEAIEKYVSSKERQADTQMLELFRKYQMNVRNYLSIPTTVLSKT